MILPALPRWVWVGLAGLALLVALWGTVGIKLKTWWDTRDLARAEQAAKDAEAKATRAIGDLDRAKAELAGQRAATERERQEIARLRQESAQAVARAQAAEERAATARGEAERLAGLVARLEVERQAMARVRTLREAGEALRRLGY